MSIRVTLAASVVGTVLLVLFRQSLAITVFKEPRLADALLWISLAVIPYSLMRVYSGALRALKDILRMTVGFDTSNRVFRFALFLMLYYAGFKLLGLVWSTVLACVLSAALLAFFLRQQGPLIFGRSAVKPEDIPRREEMLYAGAMFTDMFVAFAMQHSGRIILGVYLTSADVGIYNVVAMLSMLITFVMLSFNSVFSAVISDLYHTDRSELLASLFRSVARWTIILSLPIYVWILVAGESTLAVFGREFVRGYAGLSFLSTGYFIAIATGPVGIALAMTKHQKWNVLNAVALAVISVILNIALVPKMGVTGAGLAAGIAQALVKLARLVQVRFLLKLTPYDTSTLKVVATTAITLALAFVARQYIGVPPGIQWSAAVLGASFGVVGLLTYAMGVKAEDKLVLAAVLRRLRRAGRRA